MQIKQEKCACLLLVFVLPLMAAKQYKSPEEYNLHAAITKDFSANDMSKVIAGLDTWKAKFPDSEWASNRQLLYVQAYSRASQPAKAIEAARPVLNGPFDSPDDQLRLVYTVAAAVLQLPSPDAEQRSISSEAANKLIAFDTMPSGMKPEEWPKARTQLQITASGALVHIALTPVRDAITANDCANAETSARKVVQDFPLSVQAAWVFGSAELCLARKAPEKYPSALYAFARAAALDPVKGLVDPAWQKSTVMPYLEKLYTQYHGVDPKGLDELKAAALNSPLPPSEFTIASATQLEQRKQAEFESKNPELALWMRIKSALTASNGENYFESELKNAAVPALAGALISAKPDCRPTQLFIAIPHPGTATASSPEILLKLSKPLAGKPESNTAIRFEGIPSSFTRDPFLLTMDAEPAKVTGLKVVPCSTPSPRKR